MKYGRLFTEGDVRALLGGVVDVAEVDSMLDSFRGHFPADEPLFLLRGQDKAAPRAIADDVDGEADYLQAARSVGAAPSLCVSIAAAAAEMRRWQREHPDRVKVPD